MSKADCFICRKHKGEISVSGGCIYEDEFVYVGHIGSNDSLVYLGYLIVDLKRHASGYGDMTDDEARTIGFILNKLGKALKSEGAEHVYSFVQGDAFPHFHVHFIPRYPNTPLDYWNPMNLKNWKEAQGTNSQVEEVCSRLRKVLKNDVK
ncbi:HIT family protein [Paenibacillus sp. LHD-38]|uniref:HIT family protein n=1 Tax=Paenibacillus sp. LHD-38 TaxID=3072143 RepID=UPI00280E8B7C|nr:HIT family protein [Paenibacillus sp. LHD-38]MDQ8737692.1 HIT family protein [Paenibacillus sp. LHD-38]